MRPAPRAATTDFAWCDKHAGSWNRLLQSCDGTPPFAGTDTAGSYNQLINSCNQQSAVLQPTEAVGKRGPRRR